jgi:hypothetical protein
MKRIFLTSAILHLTFFISSSQLPDTDIWLLDMNKKDTLFTLGDPLNVTNRTGYDNQPAFSPDGSYFLYTSVRDDGQADIYKYDLGAKNVSAFCKTSESEYSPTFTPDHKFISCVRVEKDSAQRLWKFPITGGEPSLVMKNVGSIGYHCWINKDSLALFILTKPFTLQLVNINAQKPIVISDSIGKSLLRFRMMHSAGVLFIRETKGKKMICLSTLQFSKKNKYDVEEIMALPENSEYFAFFNNTFFCAAGGKIFKSEMMKDKGWILITDLSSKGVNNVSRIAISGDGRHMAIVNSK